MSNGPWRRLDNTRGAAGADGRDVRRRRRQAGRKREKGRLVSSEEDGRRRGNETESLKFRDFGSGESFLPEIVGADVRRLGSSGGMGSSPPNVGAYSRDWRRRREEAGFFGWDGSSPPNVGAYSRDGSRREEAGFLGWDGVFAS